MKLGQSGLASHQSGRPSFGPRTPRASGAPPISLGRLFAAGRAEGSGRIVAAADSLQQQLTELSTAGRRLALQRREYEERRDVKLREWAAEQLSDKAIARPDGSRPWPHAENTGVHVAQVVMPAKHMAKHVLETAPPSLRDAIMDMWEELHHICRKEGGGRGAASSRGFLSAQEIVLHCRHVLVPQADARQGSDASAESVALHCLQGSSPRDILDQGMLVLRLTSAGDDDVWFHIGYQNLVTWRASVLALTPP